MHDEVVRYNEWEPKVGWEMSRYNEREPKGRRN